MHRVSLFTVLTILMISRLVTCAPVLAQSVTSTDSMDSAVTGLLSTESSDPASAQAYQKGQHLEQAFDPAFEGEPTSCHGVPEMAISRLAIDPTAGVVNFLSLTVYQGVALLSGNTFSAVAVIPLQGFPITGEIKGEIGFLPRSLD